MLEFTPITKDALQIIAPFLYDNPGRICDFCGVNLYLWAGYFYHAYAIEDDMLYLELITEDGDVAYTVPRGNGNVDEALLRLQAHVQQSGHRLWLSLVSEDELVAVRRAFGETVSVSSSREWCDYLYDAQKMARYEGSDYAKQRNHKRRFERQYPDYRIERLTPKHISDVCALLQRFAMVRSKDDELAEQEIAVAQTALFRMEELALLGVVLYVGDVPVGFSAGSRSADTLYVHFEKADTSYDGVYQMLVYAFANAFVGEDIAFINREEDCGDEGLRRSKLAYHPVALLEKYNVLVENP